MLDFGQFDFGQFDFGQLAEVEIGRNRNWPKSKLAEVEQMVFALFLLSLFLFFLLLSFYSSLLFSCAYSSLSLHFVFVLFPNPEPCTPFLMDPSAGPPPPVNPPPLDNPPPDNLRRTTRTTLRRTTLRRTAQNFALFFPPPATIFILLSLSWGPFVEFWWCF